MAHALLLCWAGQTLPPNSWSRVTLRDRWAIPPPQEWVQSVHALQSDTMQSTGQLCAPQSRRSERCWQATPPKAARRTIERERDEEPPPQDAEHADHVLKGSSLQSTAHSAVLHSCVSRRGGHW